MSAKGKFPLAENVDATGNYVSVPSGRYAFRASGTWGEGTVKLQAKGPNDAACDVDGASLTADGQKVVDLCGGEYRANIDTATDVYADLVHIGP